METEQAPTPPFLTVPQFAARVGLSDRAAYREVESGRVGHLPSPIRIPESEVPAYLARTYVPAKPDKEVAA